jgi:hypothetical protein
MPLTPLPGLRFSQLRLNPQQLEEKKAAEDAVAEIKELITAEDDDSKKADLEEELKARQSALDELMEGFEVSDQDYAGVKQHKVMKCLS